MNEPTTSHRLRAMIFHPLGEMIIDHDTIYQTNKQIISGHHYERTSKHAGDLINVFCKLVAAASSSISYDSILIICTLLPLVVVVVVGQLTQHEQISLLLVGTLS